MIIKNRNLFRITRFILLKLPLLLKFFAKFRAPQKRLLIIKTDAIGDYILFRNFIEIIKNAEPFHDHTIDLVGNELWREIALNYDSDFVNNFYFIKPDDLYGAPWQTLKLAWRLFKNNYQTVLQPTYARTFIGDGIAGFTASKQIIAFAGDIERISIKYKTKTDKFYTQTLQLPAECRFEFYKSKFFFEKVLGQALSISSTFILVSNIDRDGVVVFPGAGVSKRGWEKEKFLALIKLIISDSISHVYIAGSPADLKISRYLMENLPPARVTDLTGNTSLTQMIELVGHSALVIANETAAIHIAAATRTRSVCILGGGHFGRFAPYPETMESAPRCVYQKMECFHCNWSCIYQTTPDEPYPCIGAVNLNTAWEAIKPLLASGLLK